MSRERHDDPVPDGYVRIPGSGGFDYPRGIDLGPEFLLHLRDEDRRAGRTVRPMSPHGHGRDDTCPSCQREHFGHTHVCDESCSQYEPPTTTTPAR